MFGWENIPLLGLEIEGKSILASWHHKGGNQVLKEGHKFN